MPDLFADHEPPTTGPYRVPVAPLARTTDPATSVEAAANHQRSGKLNRNCAIVLNLVKDHPRSTYYELFTVQVETDLESSEVMRRLNDLCHAGLVQKCQSRACTVRGSTMTTWEVV